MNKIPRQNAWERISNVGGVNGDGTHWRQTLDQAITGVENGTWSFFTYAGGRIADVVVATSRYGHKYLKTVADGEQPDNLLALPECP